ncbi:hypothetical protein [Pseudoalteromonas sp.]|uniref:hypothetical protein n=1 Tax=Pseudoalteromonas sp. TaxID=53249 RepID=UPI002603F823|nr:hypothetical protein [Pseudoalteromonas sp.]MCP4585347.1 hypothetical protein [Pseudoalteromonas sp.]
MYKFNNKQEYTQATGVNFPYLITNIMQPTKIDTIVCSDSGKKFKVIKTDTFKAYFDTDHHYLNCDKQDSFKTIYGTMQKVTVQEYYIKGSPEAALYKKYVTTYNIRIK